MSSSLYVPPVELSNNGIDMGGEPITSVDITPINNADAASKVYADLTVDYDGQNLGDGRPFLEQKL